MPGETRSRPAFTPSVHAGPSRGSFTLHAASFTPSVHSILQRSRALFTHLSTRSRAPFTHSVHAFTRSAHPFTRTATPVRRTGRVSVIGVQIDSQQSTLTAELSARQLAWLGRHGARRPRRQQPTPGAPRNRACSRADTACGVKWHQVPPRAAGRSGGVSGATGSGRARARARARRRRAR